VSAFDNVVMVECRNDECPTLVEQLECGDCGGDGHHGQRVRCETCCGRGQCEPHKDHRREAWQVTLGPSSYGRRFIVAGDERCPRCGGESMEVIQ
jgi:hypothetical protein